MQYPRVIVLNDPKLRELLINKNKKIIEGREVSIEIEETQAEMDKIEAEIAELESKVDKADLDEEAKKITDEFNILVDRMKVVEKATYERLKASIPPELGIKYEAKKKKKEELENKRNKIGLKVQKWKDIIIPRTQEIAKKHLQDEFEDFNEIRIENGEVILEIFSHLETWKEARRKKLNEKIA